MDISPADATPAAALHSPGSELRAEVTGTVLLFLLAVLVTAGVALASHAIVSLVG